MTSISRLAFPVCLSALIGLASACTATPAVPGAAPMHVQRYDALAPDTTWSQEHAAASNVADADKANAAVYAKGFQEGYIDCIRALRSAEQRKAKELQRVKLGDRFSQPGAMDMPDTKLTAQP